MARCVHIFSGKRSQKHSMFQVSLKNTRIHHSTHSIQPEKRQFSVLRWHCYFEEENSPQVWWCNRAEMDVAIAAFH
jgi:hypothetical protein